MNNDELIELYNDIENEINNVINDLKKLLENENIENVNLINIHYKLNDLLIKKHEIKNKIYNKVIHES